MISEAQKQVLNPSFLAPLPDYAICTLDSIEQVKVCFSTPSISVEWKKIHLKCTHCCLRKNKNTPLLVFHNVLKNGPFSLLTMKGLEGKHSVRHAHYEILKTASSNITEWAKRSSSKMSWKCLCCESLTIVTEYLNGYGVASKLFQLSKFSYGEIQSVMLLLLLNIVEFSNFNNNNKKMFIVNEMCCIPN